MGKWLIPRHQPRKSSEYEKRDRNRAKKNRREHEYRLQREEKERTRNIAFLDIVAAQGNQKKTSLAKQMIGQCERKKKLTKETARLCAKSAAFETGADFYVYKCKWCGSYHLTRHPIKGEVYEIVIRSNKDNGGNIQ